MWFLVCCDHRPDSLMAQEWCLLYGILNTKDAEKLHAARGGSSSNNNNNSKLSATKKSAATAPAAAAAPRKKSKVTVDGDDEADTGFAGSSGWEGRGSMGL